LGDLSAGEHRANHRTGHDNGLRVVQVQTNRFDDLHIEAVSTAEPVLANAERVFYLEEDFHV
jgi:hypothetical protein